MRRRIAAVTAVLVGSVAVAVAGVSAGALPARAATGQASITVRAIDREGNTVAVIASLQSVASDNVMDTLTSAHTTAVPDGVYNIAAWVWEPGRKAATLVDREITIGSSQTVTFDARPGKQVRFTVNDPTVAVDSMLVEPYSAATGIDTWWNDSYGPISGAAVYVVPGQLPTGWDLFLEADLVRHEPGGVASPVEYNLVKIASGSIPSNPTVASTRAGLAQDHLTIRDWDQGTDGFAFTPREFGANGSGFGQLPTIGFGQMNVFPPAGVDEFFSPGYRWESVDYAAGDDYIGTSPLLAGHSYSQTFGAAVFGPSPSFGPSVYGTTIGLSETFGNDLLVDPNGEGAGSESTGRYVSGVQGWLYQGSKLIEHASGYGANFTAKIGTARQQYQLKLAATADGTIAKSVTAAYWFTASADDTTLIDQSFWPRVVAQGLSEKDTAAGGSRTTLPITFDTAAGAIAAHNVAVWASANGGKTWTRLGVSHSGSTWTATVSNPRAAGYVSLKIQGADSLGFGTLVTLVNAYAVS